MRGVGEPVVLGEGADGVDAGALVVVLGGDQRVAVHDRRAHPGQPADAVEAACEDLQHGRAHAWPRLWEAAGEQVLQRLRAGDQGGHAAFALGPVRPGVRPGVQLGEVVEHLLVDPLPGPLQQRLLEVAVAHLAGEVAHGLVAAPGRRHQAVEHCPQRRVGGHPQHIAVPQPPLEDRGDRRELPFDPAVGLVDKEQALGGHRPAVQWGGPVVAERAAELVEEGRRQPLGRPLWEPQVGVEVPLGAADLLPLHLGRVRLGAEQRADVGEGGEHLVLGAQQRPLARVELLDRGRVVVEEPRRVGRADVEAEHLAVHALDRPPGTGERAVRRRGCGRCGGRCGAGRCGGRRRRLLAEADALGRRLPVICRLDPQQRRARVDLHVAGGQHALHPAAERRRHRGLHFHGLEHRQLVAGRHQVARPHSHRHHHGRRRRRHQAVAVARDAVGHALDLDEVVGAAQHRQHAPAAAAVRQPSLEAPGPLDLDVGAVAVHPHLVRARPDPTDRDAVGVAVVAEVGRQPHVLPHLRAAPGRAGVEARLLGGQLGVVCLHRRLHQRDVGVATARPPSRGGQPVQPAHLDRAGPQVGMLEQLQQERLVAGAATDHDGALGQGPAEPRQRLAAVAAPGGQRGDHRVELCGDHLALDQAGPGAEPRPGRDAQQVKHAGGGREMVVGVLGAEAHLDGMAERGRRPVRKAPAAGHVELQLDEVQPGGDLGDRVPGIQARTEFHERERAALQVVEELDRAGAAVAGRLAEAHGRLADLPVLPGRERRGGGLLQHPPVAPPHAALPHAGRPDGAVVVGDDLDADVPGAGGRRGAARRPAAPRGDRHPGRLREPLCAGLVTEPAHHRGTRTDEDHAEPPAQLGELRMVGHHAPAGPRGLGPALQQRPLQARAVEVAAAEPATVVREGRRADADGVVGLAREHRGAVDVGVEHHRLQPQALLAVELVDRVDQPHGGLAAVHDGDSLELPLHCRSRRSSSCRTFPPASGAHSKPCWRSRYRSSRQEAPSRQERPRRRRVVVPRVG